MVEYKFPISIDKKCLHSIFLFDLETFIVEYSEQCKSYAGRVCHPKNSYECFNGQFKET